MVRNFPTLSRENSSSGIQLQRVSQEAMQPNRLGTVKSRGNQYLLLTASVMTFPTSNMLSRMIDGSWTLVWRYLQSKWQLPLACPNNVPLHFQQVQEKMAKSGVLAQVPQKKGGRRDSPSLSSTCNCINTDWNSLKQYCLPGFSGDKWWVTLSEI